MAWTRMMEAGSVDLKAMVTTIMMVVLRVQKKVMQYPMEHLRV
jgi:hypothetical protein